MGDREEAQLLLTCCLGLLHSHTPCPVCWSVLLQHQAHQYAQSVLQQKLSVLPAELFALASFPSPLFCSQCFLPVLVQGFRERNST